MEYLYMMNFKLKKNPIASLFDLIKDREILVDNNSKYKSVIIEGRHRQNLEFTIKNTIYNLPDNWGHIIFCSYDNEKKIRKLCETISEKIDIRVSENPTYDEYNCMFYNEEFYKSLECDYMLVYQCDSFIFRKFDESFYDHEFIGANIDTYRVKSITKKIFNNSDIKFMNGGLNFSNINKRIEYLEDVDNIKIRKLDKNLTYLHEDIYFSYYFNKDEKIIYKDNLFSYDIYDKKLYNENEFININYFGCHNYRFYFDENVFKQKWLNF